MCVCKVSWILRVTWLPLFRVLAVLQLKNRRDYNKKVHQFLKFNTWTKNRSVKYAE